MGLSVSLWISVGLYGVVVRFHGVHMGLYWVLMSPCRSLWGLYGSLGGRYGFLWVPMSSYGVSMGLCGSL